MRMAGVEIYCLIVQKKQSNINYENKKVDITIVIIIGFMHAWHSYLLVCRLLIRKQYYYL
jgi:predicted ferric reductase